MRSLILAVPLLLVAPGVAGAAVTPGDYGGGSLDGAKSLTLRTGNGWMWARVAADGHARIGGAFKVACGLTRFDAEVALAADGSFDFTRVRRARETGHRLRAVVRVRGRFDGAAASGTARGVLRNRLPNGTVRRCSTRGARSWQLRLPAAPGPSAPAQPGATYLGLTSEQADVPRPFLLLVSRNGSRVKTSVFEYTRRCRRRTYFLNDTTPSARIRADGSFSIRERFTLRYADVPQNERFRVRVDGRFAAGAVSGTLRVTSVARRRGTGRVVDRCDTGPVTFAAQP